MTRWGLVIGSGFDDPRGIENDTRLITDLLTGRGFDVETLLGPDATRVRILAACDEIVARAGRDDAVAIYYAGHGVMVTNTDRQAAHDLPRTFRAICPTDYAASSDRAFRGISSFELSIQLAALTERTPNVTMIFDCCYAAHLCRGAGAAGRRARALEVPSRLAVSRHLQELRERGALRELEVPGNPDAVRVVAAGESSGAFPTRLPTTPLWLSRVGGSGAHDGQVGALTLALVDTLHTIGDAELPWQSIARALRREVRAHGDGQRPDIEGPIRRLPFTLTERDAASVPADAVATASELAFERRAVRVVAPEPQHARIASALAATGKLSVAGPQADDVLADVVLRGDRLVIRDAEDALFDPVPYPIHLGDAANDLAALATVQRLRSLEPEQGVARSDVEVVWGTVAHGLEQPRPDHGFAVGLDDLIYVRLRNRSSQPLYAHVFHIGLRGRIALLSSCELEPQQERTLGADIDEQLRGIPLAWPVGLSRRRPGVDTLLAIFTTAPTDLARGGGGTLLQRLLGQPGGAAPDQRAEVEPHAMVWRDYWLFPLQARLATTEFEIDHKPLGVRPIAPGDTANAPGEICLRLRDLELVLGDGATATNLRIDVLVCTRTPQGASPYRARTFRLAELAGAGLADDLLWAGPAREFADVYLWVSSGDPEAGDLSELLWLSGNTACMRDCVSALYDRADSGGSSLASAASSAIAALACDALRRVADDITGLYRGSLPLRALTEPSLSARHQTSRLSFGLDLALISARSRSLA